MRVTLACFQCTYLLVIIKHIYMYFTYYLSSEILWLLLEMDNSVNTRIQLSSN